MILSIIGTVATAIGLGSLGVVATRRRLFQTDTVDPFQKVATADPSQDTLCSEVATPTIFAQNSGWKLVTLDNLRAVEDLLDCLESSKIAEREVHTLGNSSFAVRWR